MYLLGSILEIVGGGFWLSLPFYPPHCVPVTEFSEVFCNRLWSPAFGAMLIGTVALQLQLRKVTLRGAAPMFRAIVLGFAMITVGNVGEYWLAYQLPHQAGPGAMVRTVLWMSVLAGWLTLLIGSAVVGIGLLRSSVRDRWIGWLYVLPLPLTFGLAALGGPSFAGLPVGLLGIIVGVHGLRAKPVLPSP